MRKLIIAALLLLTMNLLGQNVILKDTPKDEGMALQIKPKGVRQTIVEDFGTYATQPIYFGTDPSFAKPDDDGRKYIIPAKLESIDLATAQHKPSINSSGQEILYVTNSGPKYPNPINKDTVAPKAPKEPPTFFLIGKQGDFQLLIRAIADPENVTPAQVKAVLNWIAKPMAVPDSLLKK